MSRVITISMICVMPAAMSVIRKRRRATADFSRIYRQKGVAKEFIEQALLEEGNEDENRAIQRLLEKKGYTPEMPREQANKIYQFLI